MKNLFLSLAFMLIGSLSFANHSKVKPTTSKSEKKETVRMQMYDVYCNGKYKGSFTCDGCNTQAVGNAMCNG